MQKVVAGFGVLGIELLPRSRVNFYIMKREQRNFRIKAGSLPFNSSLMPGVLLSFPGYLRWKGALLTVTPVVLTMVWSPL